MPLSPELNNSTWFFYHEFYQSFYLGYMKLTRLYLSSHYRAVVNNIFILQAMMNLTALLSILAAFIGFVGVFAMHNDLYEVTQFTIKPLINKINQITVEVWTTELFIEL